MVSPKYFAIEFETLYVLYFYIKLKLTLFIKKI